MELKPIDTRLDSLFREIQRRIHRLQSGGTIDSLMQIGADTGHQIGASFVSLKSLASRYNPDESLALMLWRTGKREEQIIGCMLLPPEINAEKIMQLMDYCLNLEVASYMGSQYLYRHPGLAALAQSWSDSGNPTLQTAILTALARNLIIYKGKGSISREAFQEILQKEYKNEYVRLTAERYRFNL